MPGVLALGDSDALRPGDRVVAIGATLGEYANTVTDGTVNATGRDLDTSAGYRLPNLVQHDAELWPDNFGGPLLNLAGEVIEMNVAGATDAPRGDAGTEIGFAIASGTVAALVAEIVASGAVARPFLGSEGEVEAAGHLVLNVVVDGPAAAAGSRRGDTVGAVDGRAVTGDAPLLNLLFAHDPGDDVAVTLDRDGAERTVRVALGERLVATTEAAAMSRRGSR